MGGWTYPTTGDPSTGSGAAGQIGGAENALTYLIPAAIGAVVGGALLGRAGAVLGGVAGAYLAAQRVFRGGL